MPVPLNAEEAQTLQALAALTGMDKLEYLASMVRAGLARQDVLMGSLNSQSPAQLRVALCVNDGYLNGARQRARETEQ